MRARKQVAVLQLHARTGKRGNVNAIVHAAAGVTRLRYVASAMRGICAGYAEYAIHPCAVLRGYAGAIRAVFVPEVGLGIFYHKLQADAVASANGKRILRQERSGLQGNAHRHAHLSAVAAAAVGVQRQQVVHAAIGHRRSGLDVGFALPNELPAAPPLPADSALYGHERRACGEAKRIALANANVGRDVVNVHGGVDENLHRVGQRCAGVAGFRNILALLLRQHVRNGVERIRRKGIRRSGNAPQVGVSVFCRKHQRQAVAFAKRERRQAAVQRRFEADRLHYLHGAGGGVAVVAVGGNKHVCSRIYRRDDAKAQRVYPRSAGHWHAVAVPQHAVGKDSICRQR